MFLNRKSLYLLHGFLGEKSDWEFLTPLKKNYNLIPIDIYSKTLPHPKEGLWKWAEALNAMLLPSSKNAIIGYSLGGRLAMHTLLAFPEKWSAAVLISSHTGLKTPEEKLVRIAKDLQWAKRFSEEKWDTVMEKWNALPIFSETKAIQRCEEHYNKELLSATLKHWSLGKQENLRDKLKALPMPLLQIAGEKDKKYASTTPDLYSNKSSFCLSIINRAGHRVFWENPNKCLSLIETFLSQKFHPIPTPPLTPLK